MVLNVGCVGMRVFQPFLDLKMAPIILINYLARHDPLKSLNQAAHIEVLKILLR